MVRTRKRRYRSPSPPPQQTPINIPAKKPKKSALDALIEAESEEERARGTPDGIFAMERVRARRRVFVCEEIQKAHAEWTEQRLYAQKVLNRLRKTFVERIVYEETWISEANEGPGCNFCVTLRSRDGGLFRWTSRTNAEDFVRTLYYSEQERTECEEDGVMGTVLATVAQAHVESFLQYLYVTLELWAIPLVSQDALWE